MIIVYYWGRHCVGGIVRLLGLAGEAADGDL